ncbi:MAG: endonuclease/exonuclease/phosphatase [Myxococcales bacterium]|nr:endonuclease/exonuclease/phosphatase [Myxococcales bacterium]
MPRSHPFLRAFAVLLWLPGIAAAQPLDVVGWNTESGDADPAVIAQTLRDTGGIDIWGLSEVLAQWEDGFRGAAAEASGRRFESVLGTTGGADRLLVLYDAERFHEVRHFELHHINYQRRVRSPLVVELRDRESDLAFLFMVNHLYRSRADQRLVQSQQLREWAANERLPVIAVGDYNYDWHFRNGDADHDPGYDELVAGGVFSWVRPAALIPTQCSRYESVLDFVFAGGAARAWRPESRILEARDDYCPDDGERSDHRPVYATFDTDHGHRIALRDESLERLDVIEDELHVLRELVERFD